MVVNDILNSVSDYYRAHGIFLLPLVLIIYLIAAYFTNKNNYAQTEYRVFPDMVEFQEGISKKQVRFGDVKEIVLHKGSIQKKSNLGSVYLATIPTPPSIRNDSFRTLWFAGGRDSGIIIKDIENPDQAYEKIKQLVDSQTKQID